MSHPWLFAVCVILLMVFVAFTTYRSGLLLREWVPPINLMLSVPDNLLRLALMGICLALGYGLGPGPAVLGWDTAYLAQDLAWGGAVGLLLTGLVMGAGQAIARRWGPDVYSPRLVQCILPLNRREWAGVLLALLPAAALEELLFRSLPLAGLAWLVTPGWLMWPLAVLFGLLHWPQGGWGVTGTALVAIAFSLLFLTTKSIWAPLAAHYVMNVAQLIVAVRLGLRPLRAAL